MAKKRDGFLKVVEERVGNGYFYSPVSTRPLPDWMRDRSLLPSKPPGVQAGQKVPKPHP